MFTSFTFICIQMAKLITFVKFLKQLYCSLILSDR